MDPLLDIGRGDPERSGRVGGGKMELGAIGEPGGTGELGITGELP